MNAAFEIISHLLEAEEEGEVKELAIPEEPSAGATTVKRYGRWKVVDMADYQFLISFLTPVAYLDKRTGVFYQTSKQWSPTTNQHIRDWESLIERSPEWKADPTHKKRRPPTEWNPEGGEYIEGPQFVRKRQVRISALFRQLMPTMRMKPHMKRRMYHVAPQMRVGASIQARVPGWLGGHLKHHPTGEEGLPRPDDPGYEEFFAGFTPDEPEMYDWQGSSYRSQEPYEPDERKHR